MSIGEIALLWEKLQEARTRRLELRERVEALEAQMRSTPEGRLWIEALQAFQEAQLEEDEAEHALRRLAVEVFRASGLRNLHPKVSVKVRKVPRFDADAVTDWCRKNLPDLLVLGEKRFRKYVLSVDGVLPLPPGVEIEEEPFAVLSVGNGFAC